MRHTTSLKWFASLRRLFARRRQSRRRVEPDGWILEQIEFFRRDRDRRDARMIEKYAQRPYNGFSTKGAKKWLI